MYVTSKQEKSPQEERKFMEVKKPDHSRENKKYINFTNWLFNY